MTTRSSRRSPTRCGPLIDATGCVIDEGNAIVFFVVDHRTAEAMECLHEAIGAVKGRYDTNIAEGTELRHDYGSHFISHPFQDDLEAAGIESSPPSSASPRATNVSSGSSAP